MTPLEKAIQYIVLAAFLTVAGSAIALSGTVPPDSTIFPGQAGTQLIASLVTAYKSTTNLGYNAGRDTMYGVIDKVNDSLECVYSGYRIYMQPGQDPSTWAYDHGINCEHTWPQSMLSSGTAEADLHHLYPTDIEVNGARDNDPFSDIPDAQTVTWYYNNTTMTTIPTSNIDLYAEEAPGTFEPREMQKGNTARSMYYVLTMWQLPDTNLAWWTGQMNTLFAWHANDPADAREIARTRKIATYQQNKPNPFVLDSTLVRRAYFPNMGVTGGPEAPTAGASLLGNQPNPFKSSTTILYSLAMPARAEIAIYNVLGRKVATLRGLASGPGPHKAVWTGRGAAGALQPPGIYFYRLRVDGVPAATGRMLLIK